MVSAAIATLVFALASAVESDASFLLTYPGLLFTWPFWPEGIHTGSGGIASALGFYVVFVVGNLLLWTVAVRLILALLLRLRGKPVGSEETGG